MQIQSAVGQGNLFHIYNGEQIICFHSNKQAFHSLYYLFLLKQLVYIDRLPNLQKSNIRGHEN